ncbi:orotate phosphoribosyltransferase [Telmatospirillum siberiense]|uniref:Orotate phosphoribosyltransferase n=1 Tax=Telmatospirillum siberiense TaxID=382514 RepID=A0A2N3PR60_9PROT|nr:orotate phosphoribosyltransferase [Telmatospirillum siberiense]PKU22881.1 orotate phosphoribosyltransferase [Telmatospirillum siberiense]
MQSVSRTPEQRQAGLTTARILLEIGAVNFRPEDPYILTSGWKSPVYIDLLRVISFPRARRKITRLSAEAITREVGFESIEAVAGGETAGIPYAAWISNKLSLPMLYVRKQAKTFGRHEQIEGRLRKGERVLLVGDLASDGTSKVNFCQALRQAGAEVSHAFVVFFYGVFPGAMKALEEVGVEMIYLANWWDILDVAEEDGFFDKPAIEEVRKFLHDPIAWSAHNGGRSA